MRRRVAFSGPERQIIASTVVVSVFSASLLSHGGFFFVKTQMVKSFNTVNSLLLRLYHEYLVVL